MLPVEAFCGAGAGVLFACSTGRKSDSRDFIEGCKVLMGMVSLK